MPEYELVGRLRPGDHVCWAFEDDETRDRTLSAYISGAASEHHKAIYFTHSTTPAAFLETMASTGLDVERLTGSGQLEVFTAEESYLSTGRFEASAMIDGCLAASAESRAAGFTGLRLAGDMSWAVSPVAGSERLDWYEAQVTRVYTEGYAIGLCLYDARLFDTPRLLEIRGVHPCAVDPGTDLEWTPMLRIRQLDGAPGLRLDGEADLSNQAALVAMLDNLRLDPVHGPPILDVHRLRFVDITTVNSIVAAAIRLGTLRVVGASAQLTRLLNFIGEGEIPGLVIEPADGVKPAV